MFTSLMSKLYKIIVVNDHNYLVENEGKEKKAVKSIEKSTWA